MSAWLSPEVRELCDCGSRESEYWTHVSSQDELPIAAGASATPLLAKVDAILEATPLDSGADRLAEVVEGCLLSEPGLIHQLRLLIGLSDKRMYLDLSYAFSRTAGVGTAPTLCGCKPHELTRHSLSFFEQMLSGGSARGQKAAKLIARYLVEKGIGDILGVYKKLTAGQRATVIARLVLPKEAQQNEAKRRGHGAEVEFARAVQMLGCGFLPKDKITNPMGSGDPNVDPDTFTLAKREPGRTYSFDVLVADGKGNIAVCVQGLVQSSDPGQFGVDKSNQTVEIRKLIDRFNARSSGRSVQLWGVVDGVGYSENKEGTINKMLSAFHVFVQMRSLYKVGLALHELGLCSVKAILFDRTFYSESALQQMCRYVPEDVEVLAVGALPNAAFQRVTLGCATLFV